MAGLIEFSGSEIEFNGEFFRGDPAKQLKQNLSGHVGKLAEDGRKYVVRQIATRPFSNERARYPSRRRTGFTQRHIEAYQDPPNSLYAKVRMKPDARRPGAKATAAYPAERIPYIITAVLETGRRGGRHVQATRVSAGWRARTRRKWQHGDRQGGQKPLFAFRRAVTMLRLRAGAIRESILLKGLN